jgi:hypothetical protein
MPDMLLDALHLIIESAFPGYTGGADKVERYPSVVTRGAFRVRRDVYTVHDETYLGYTVVWDSGFETIRLAECGYQIGGNGYNPLTDVRPIVG